MPLAKLSVYWQKVFGNWRKYEQLTLALSCCLLLAAGIWGLSLWQGNDPTTPAHGGWLRVGLVGRVGTLNPLLVATDAEKALAAALYAGLYTYDAAGQLTPALAAEMPEISQQGRRYQVKLKPGLTWHDGSPLTSQDIAFTVHLVQDNALTSKWHDAWQGVQTEILSDTEISFHLPEPRNFLGSLTLPLLPKARWEKLPADSFAHPDQNTSRVGSSAWQLIETKRNDHSINLHLGSFPKFSQPSFLDGLDVTVFSSAKALSSAWEKGQLDAIYTDSLPAKKKRGQREQSTAIATGRFLAVFFQLSDPLLQDSVVRQALRLATSSGEISQAWQPGSLPISSTPFGITPPPNSPPPANTAEAIGIIEANGWHARADSPVREKNGQKLEIELVLPDSAGMQAAAEVIRAGWQKLGIAIKLTILPSEELTEKRLKPRNFQAALLVQNNQIAPDPFSLWHTSQKRDPGLNITGFSSTEADGLIIKSMQETNAEKKQELLDKLRSLLEQKQPALYLAQGYHYLTFKPKMHGVDAATWFGGEQNWLQILTPAYLRSQKSSPN